MTAILSDVRQALRRMSRTPLATAVIVLSLGVGLGVNTAVFSWMQVLTLRPLPGVGDASRIHLIETRTAGGVRPGLSWPEYLDLSRDVQALGALAAFRMTPVNVGEAAQTARSYALLVSGNYFDLLRLPAAAGRLLQSSDRAVPGREPVVVVSHDYWQTRLGGAADITGRPLRINGTDLTIVGVAPPGFQGTVLGLQFDLFIPASMAPALLPGSRELEDRRERGYYVMGAVASAADAAAAQAQVDRIMARLARDFPLSNDGVAADVLPFWRASRGPQGFLLQGLAVLQAIMLLLLLAACGNAAMLMLAQATVRQHEIGVRVALGAGRVRLWTLMLAEPLLLALAGAVLGLGLAWWGARAIERMPLLTTQFPVRFDFDLNGLGVVFALTLAALCALVVSVAPAAQVMGVTPQVLMRSHLASGPRRVMRHALVGIQVMLASVVLIAAALFLRAFQETRDTDPGFQPQGVLLAAYELPRASVDRDEARRFAAQVLAELRRLPAVQSAALATSVPLDIHGLPARAFMLEGRAAASASPERALSNTVSDGYFGVMGIDILDGQDFAPLDDLSPSPQAIVNEAFARRYIGEGSVLGRRLTVGGTTFTIIAIVRTTVSDAFGEPPAPVIYLSFRDRAAAFAEMHLRTTLPEPGALAPALGQAVRAVEAAQPIFNVRTLASHVDMNLTLRRIPARLFVVIGPLILLLAAVGVYALVALDVARQAPEIGIRMALGASPHQVTRQYLLPTLRVAVAGLMMGWLLAAIVYSHLIRGALAPVAFLDAPLLLLLVTVAATWMPARRAARLDPTAAWRL